MAGNLEPRQPRPAELDDLVLGCLATGPELDLVTPTGTGVTSFDDPELVKLEDAVATANLDLKVASLRLAESRATRAVTAANQYPAVEAKAGALRPSLFNRVLTLVAGQDYEALVNEVVLRSQAQAEYSAENYGHFGLNLRRYAHFTSPIRRYADLIVHRGLIRALGLGEGALPNSETAEHLSEVAAEISVTLILSTFCCSCPAAKGMSRQNVSR